MVQNKVGRPKKFEREVALDAAVEVFWAKGYDGSSLDDLTKAMGINRPSLYSTFGDKRSLYLDALAAYGAGIGSAPVVAFDEAADPREAVSAFLTVLVENQTRSGDRAQGCLMASCAATTAGEIPEVGDMLAIGAKAASIILERGFEKFKQEKQLPASFSSKAKAGLLLDIMHGFAYRSRAGEGRKNLIAEIEEKVGQVIPAL
ncbi:MAG: TetR/AcrR family transcriptional regulator [Rhizobiaceae bacterium]